MVLFGIYFYNKFDSFSTFICIHSYCDKGWLDKLFCRCMINCMSNKYDIFLITSSSVKKKMIDTLKQGLMDDVNVCSVSNKKCKDMVKDIVREQYPFCIAKSKDSVVRCKIDTVNGKSIATCNIDGDTIKQQIDK